VKENYSKPTDAIHEKYAVIKNILELEKEMRRLNGSGTPDIRIKNKINELYKDVILHDTEYHQSRKNSGYNHPCEDMFEK